MSKPANPSPNILWIGSDEQHRGTIGAYGSCNCCTPYIDALAAESMVLTIPSVPWRYVLLPALFLAAFFLIPCGW